MIDSTPDWPTSRASRVTSTGPVAQSTLVSTDGVAVTTGASASMRTTSSGTSRPTLPATSGANAEMVVTPSEMSTSPPGPMTIGTESSATGTGPTVVTVPSAATVSADQVMPATPDWPTSSASKVTVTVCGAHAVLVSNDAVAVTTGAASSITKNANSLEPKLSWTRIT